MYVRKNSSKQIAFAGILLALNLILMMLINIIPMNTLFLMGLASLPLSIIIIEFDFKLGTLFYIASSILSLFILSNKFQWMLYVFTFGSYGLVKYIIERFKVSYFIDLFIKLMYANISMMILCYILTKFIYIPINIYTVIIFQIMFLIYDYGYSLFIDYYYDKIKIILKK